MQAYDDASAMKAATKIKEEDDDSDSFKGSVIRTTLRKQLIQTYSKTRNNKAGKFNETKDAESNESVMQTATSEIVKVNANVETSPLRSSSTPRRKRNMLNNLYSSLSPKYIGFSTPSSVARKNNDGEDTVRSLRRRNWHNNGDLQNNSTPIVNISAEDTIGCLRRTRSLNSGIVVNKKVFVSPIDKLLIKNGSTSPANSGLTTYESQIREAKLEDNILRQKRTKLKIEATKTKTESPKALEDESIVKNEVIEINSLKKEIPEQNNNKNKVAHTERQEQAEVNVVLATIETNASDNTEDVAEFVENMDINSNENTESLENRFRIEQPSVMKTEKVCIEVEGISINAVDRDAHLYVDEGSEVLLRDVVINPAAIAAMEPAIAKSPSAVSTDSAKGSSVTNSTTWMSFATGNLFWGQIYSYCYWPCMVCPDPDGKTINTEKNVRSGDQYVIVHVRFFADNGRRNWVKRDNLIPYSGLESYKERIREVRDKYGKKSAKYKLLMPKQNQKYIWLEAIDEANIIADISYTERLEKFYEIYENSKNFQQLERKRRRSMIQAVSKGSTSDIGSLYDSMDNLSTKQTLTTVKRERSVSPFSPAFSPVKSISAKRLRLANSGVQAENQTANHLYLDKTTATPTNISPEYLAMQRITPNSTSLTDMETYNSSDFKKFYIAMREFIMEHNRDEKLEKSFLLAVRNIWALKEINHVQMQQRLLEDFNEQDLGSSVVENSTGEGSVKRLSNRLKNIKIRRSLPLHNNSLKPKENNEFDTPIAKEQVVDKPKKKLINRPIEEVIDDIFNLDCKYLFKGLVREPVCKYCFQTGNKLLRCAKNCLTWFHRDCIGKKFNVNAKQSKKRNSHRSVEESSANTSLANAVEIDRLFEKPTTSRLSTDINNDIAVSELSKLNTSDTNLSESAFTHHITAESDTVMICQECALNSPAKCGVCDESDTTKEELIACSIPHCTKVFHPGCCRYWPQAKITKSKNNIESFRCPSHVCHTCVSDDPKSKFQHLGSGKLTKCLLCPASYHTDSTCIPAGSLMLTAAHIVCPRHALAKNDAQVNVNWCFICVNAERGQLICCETCPTAVHAQCLNISVDPNEGYICEECESGRMPLYGEMVWAKFTSFRWWPAIILPPTEVPQNIMRKARNPFDFVVRFFGTHDHGWISRRRVYLYLEGDCSESPRSKSHLDQRYNLGIEEAHKIYEIVKLKKQQQMLSKENKEKLHPQPYVKIKTNRAVHPIKLHINMEKVNKCDCKPTDESPCGPDSNCLNRVLYHECNAKSCPAGERCQNQMFETRISPRLEVIYMKQRGFGLVCREPITVGAFIIEYVGEIINDDEFRQRMSQKSIDRDENFYFLSIEKDYIIDAGPKGNMARFMNHSCDPNCETQKWSVNGINRVGLFAIKDIPSDTELTFNYHWDDLLGSEKKTCYCGASKCAGQIGAKYKEEKIKENYDAEPKAKGKRSVTKKSKPLKRLKSKTARGRGSKKEIQIKAKNVFKSSSVAEAKSFKIINNKSAVGASSDEMNNETSIIEKDNAEHEHVEEQNINNNDSSKTIDANIF